jgi:ketosteroid isomerase-like protein
MKKHGTLFLFGAVAAALAPTLLRCASTPAPAPASKLEKDKAALMRKDAEFSRTAQTRGIGEAFAAYAAEDATMMPMAENAAVGRAAIRKEFEGTPAEVALVWKPFSADVSRSSDLGYTLGTYEYRAPGADGKMTTRYGKYCTIWKKQANGDWKWVVDIGNTSPAPK